MSVASQTESRTVDRILAFTRAAIEKRVRDNHFNHSPLLAALSGEILGEFGRGMMAGRAKRTQTGGESIVVRPNLGANAGAKTKSGPWDTNNTAPSDTVRYARALWKFYSAPVTISDHDMRVNTGAEVLSSLIEHEMTNGYRSVGELVIQHIYSNSGSASAVTELPDVISANDAVQTLSGGDYADWNSRGISARGTAAGSISFASGSFAAQGLDDFRLAYNGASEGSMTPDAIYVPWDVYSYYEAALQPQERFTNAALADGGFQQLAFKSAPVFPDSYATTGTAWFLNFNEFEMVCLAGADFRMGDWTRIENQSARVAQVEFTGNVCVKGRKYNNKLTGITA
jgi:hypothetical protein